MDVFAAIFMVYHHQASVEEIREFLKHLNILTRVKRDPAERSKA